MTHEAVHAHGQLDMLLTGVRYSHNPADLTADKAMESTARVNAKENLLSTLPTAFLDEPRRHACEKLGFTFTVRVMTQPITDIHTCHSSRGIIFSHSFVQQ
eukprot:COSAG05_NODE_6576_length_936_cov_1.091995_1_plen_101_part_00